MHQVNEALRAARLAGGEADENDDGEDDEWGGIADEDRPPEFVNHEEEYIDEDRFTTVTVEAVNVDRDGMHRLDGHADEDDNSDNSSEAGEDGDGDATGGNGSGKGEKETGKDKKKVWPKKKKTKFRYENKIERQMSKQRQKRKR